MTAHIAFSNVSNAPRTLDETVTVLVVGAKPDEAEKLANALSALGFDTNHAVTFDDAAKTVQRDPKEHVVVVDFHQKDCAESLNQLQSLAVLCTETKKRSLPTIVIADDPGVAIDTSENLIGMVLAKPVMPETLAAFLMIDPAKFPKMEQQQDTVHQLNKAIVTQSRTIARMHNSIKQHERHIMEMTDRLDHLTSAAMLARQRCDGPGTEDLACLVDYIMTEAAMAKDLANGMRSTSLQSRAAPETREEPALLKGVH